MNYTREMERNIASMRHLTYSHALLLRNIRKRYAICQLVFRHEINHFPFGRVTMNYKELRDTIVIKILHGIPISHLYDTKTVKN
jgi:hypothetical protein